MSNTNRLAALLAAVLILSACEQQGASKATEETEVAAGVALETTEQRLSYGIAYGLGQRLKADSVPMDVAAFSSGLQHALDGTTPLLSAEEISQEMQSFQQEQTAMQQSKMEQAASANVAAGEQFLAENASNDGVVVLESGLQYRVINEGDGAMPTADDTVEVHYRGTLIDGTEFDSSYARGTPVSFGVTQVIAGWTEALQLMQVGSKWQLFIPSDLAYGAGGAGPIGPNATLLFDVELLDIEAE